MELKDAIYGRRSVRKYKDTPISKEDMIDILDAGIWAPSGTNTQPWYFVAIQNPEKLKELFDLLGTAADTFKLSLEKRFPNHPEVVRDTVQFLRALGSAQACILAYVLKPEQSNSNTAIESVSAAIENMLLAAYEKGIGSCWLAAHVQAGLGPELESRYAPGKGAFVGAITLGYPDEEPKAPKRKDGRYIII